MQRNWTEIVKIPEWKHEMVKRVFAYMHDSEPIFYALTRLHPNCFVEERTDIGKVPLSLIKLVGDDYLHQNSHVEWGDYRQIDPGCLSCFSFPITYYAMNAEVANNYYSGLEVISEELSAQSCCFGDIAVIDGKKYLVLEDANQTMNKERISLVDLDYVDLDA